MKKFLLLMLCVLSFAGAAFAYECEVSVLNSINDKQIIDYNPKTKTWSRNLGLQDYVFTKTITVGTGSFTEFTYNGKTYDTNTTYEFLSDGRLYGYNAHQLKFFELGFDGSGITGRELTKEEVQNFFPDAKIIMVSEFKDNEIEVDLPIFHKKAFMILNDTDRDFYKYQFEYYKRRSLFNNIFEVNFPRILIYSHFKSRDELFPILRIKVKPLFHFDAEYGPDNQLRF